MARPTTVSIPLLCCALLLAACQQQPGAAGLIDEARRHRQHGATQAAIIEMKNALQQEPGNATARALLGELYLDAGDALSAEKELRKAQALGLAAPLVLPALGKAMLMQGQFDKVLAEIKPVPDDRAGPDQAGVLAVRANALMALGDIGQAKRLFESILQQQPTSAMARLGLARIAAGADPGGPAGAQAAALIEQVLAADPRDLDALRLKGDLLRLQGKHDAAQRVYRQILQWRPDNVQARIDVANLLLQGGHVAAARTEVEAARNSAPNSLLALHALALLDFREGKYKAALDSLERVLRAAPGYPPSTLLMGNVQMALGAPQQAEQYLLKFLDVYPRHVYASKLLATVLLTYGKPQAVIDLLAPLLRNGQPDGELLALAGEAHLRARHFSLAADYFQQASALAPEAAALHTSLALSRLGMGENDRAVAELERATTLDAGDARAATLLVMHHLRVGDYDKALAAAQTMARQQPDNALAHHLYGGALFAKNNLAGARASFEQALRRDADFLPAMESLALLDLAEHQPEQARRRYEAALVRDPKNMGLLLALAKLARSRGKQTEELRWLQQASRDHPDARQPAALLSQLYLQSGEQRQAVDLVRKLQALHPGNADMLALLAQVQYGAGDAAGALENYLKLGQLQIPSPDLQLRIAGLQMHLHHPDAALQAVRKALAAAPGMLEAQVFEVGLLIAGGDYRQALTTARAVQREKPKQAAGYKLEGDVWMAQKQALPALQRYEQAFALARTAALLVNVHQALTLAGKTREADARFAAWLEAHPDDVASRLYLARIAQARRDYQAAIIQYEAIVRQQPKHVVALNDLAWNYQQVRDGRALATAEAAQRLAPANAAVLDTLAAIVLDRNEVARATALWQQAVALAPESPEIRYHFGLSLARSGDAQGARRQFEQLQASGKDFPGRAQLPALLAQR